MKCIKCNAEIRDDSAICPECGAETRPAEIKKAQRGTTLTIIALVCLSLLLIGSVISIVSSGRLGGSQTAPDAESGKSEAEASQDENVSEDTAEGNADSAQISENTTVTVVDVVGKAQENAAHLLEELGLKVTIEPSYSMRIPEGYVISQSVPGGEEIERETEVTLAVSAGDHWSLEENEYGSGKVDLILTYADENESINLTISFLQTGEGEADVIFYNKSDYEIYCEDYLIYALGENGRVFINDSDCNIALRQNSRKSFSLNFAGLEGKIKNIIIQNMHIVALIKMPESVTGYGKEKNTPYFQIIIYSDYNYTAENVLYEGIGY